MEEGEPYSKKELIGLAKEIANESKEVVKHARKVANQCSDRRLKQVQRVFWPFFLFLFLFLFIL